jgi:hypothetical protein
MNGYAELDYDHRRNPIVPLLIIGLVLLLLCGCKHSSAPPSAPTTHPAPIEKPSAKLLAEDLIRAGIIPGQKPRFPDGFRVKAFGDTSKTAVYGFNNGHYALDAQGKLIFIDIWDEIEKPRDASESGLSALSLTTRQGRKLIGLTKEEIISEYGPASSEFEMAEADIAELRKQDPSYETLKQGDLYSLDYDYSSGEGLIVSVSLDFKRSAKGEMKLNKIRISQPPRSENSLRDEKKKNLLFKWPNAG